MANEVTPQNAAERQALQDAVLADVTGQADAQQAAAEADAKRLMAQIIERGKQS
jgi:hypothetical protein